MPATHNIIIIEDNETFSLLVTHYLKNNLGNAKVYVENSAARAIESIQRLKPSVVILDYYLENELSAKDVMEVINQMADRPKVIMLSSMKDEKEKAEVMQMGIEQFVQKSNESFYDLVKAIDGILDTMEPANSVQKEAKQGMSKSMIYTIGAVVIIILLLLYILL